MYEWLPDAFAAQSERHREQNVPAPGASVESLARIERMIGRALAPSHRAFLAKHDGLAKIFGSEVLVLSVDEILEWHAMHGFEARTDQDDYYAELPAHLLVIRKQALGSEVYALDLRVNADELPVIEYDAETGCSTRFPGFEAMLMFAVASAADRRDTKTTRARLVELMTARGVVNAGEWDPDFSGWRSDAS